MALIFKCIYFRNDTRTSKKSLPHKKRISRKLKKNLNISRKGHKCNVCELIFNSHEELLNHSTCHDATLVVQQFSCQICNAICKDQLVFFEHLKTHYEPNMGTSIKETPIVKEEENKTDSLLSSLLPPLNCLQCGKNFRRQKAYEAHMRDAHTNKMEDEFSEPEDLMDGLRSVVEAKYQDSGDENGDNKGWYQPLRTDTTDLSLQELVCHLCGQLFNSNTDVMQHLQDCKSNVAAVNPLDDKQINKNRKKRRRGGHLACTHCDRIFSHRNSLMYHMQGHTGERPHQCDICGKSFFASSALKVYFVNFIHRASYKLELLIGHKQRDPSDKIIKIGIVS